MSEIPEQGGGFAFRPESIEAIKHRYEYLYQVKTIMEKMEAETGCSAPKVLALVETGFSEHKKLEDLVKLLNWYHAEGLELSTENIKNEVTTLLNKMFSEKDNTLNKIRRALESGRAELEDELEEVEKDKKTKSNTLRRLFGF